MWHKTNEQLPPINYLDKYDGEHGISIRVIVWLEGEDRFNAATYNYNIESWNVEGYLGFKQSRVKYWQQIYDPFKTN